MGVLAEVRLVQLNAMPDQSCTSWLTPEMAVREEELPPAKGQELANEAQQAGLAVD